MEQADIELLEAGYAAFNRRDVDAAMALLDPEIEWEEPPQLPGSATYRGHEDVRKVLKTLIEEVWEDTAYEPEEVIPVNDDQLLALVRVRHRGKGSGVELEAEIAHLWTIRDGKAVRLQQYTERAEALKAVGLAT